MRLQRIEHSFLKREEFEINFKELPQAYEAGKDFVLELKEEI